MPNVISYTPEWLARPSAGFDLLSGPTSGKAGTSTSEPLSSRRLAQRGSEIFYAVGTELRWGDLSLLEAGFQDDASEVPGRGWRNLKSPVNLPIQQLSVSPDGNLLAIVTSHTCHVSVLPAPSHLRSGEDSLLRLKSFQIGPTSHVLEQSAIASCLWHPLSTPGLQSLVTVTVDACVRMWELDVNNRHSFDRTGLAVDLKKLANATTTTSDFSANKFGANRGFSPDDVEMEVAAACFGGQGFDDEYGWASMTLWIAMVEGDIYAPCPSRHHGSDCPVAPSPSLSTGVVAKAQILAADREATESERQTSDLQSAWLADLDNQEPVLLAGQHEYDLVETYARPERTSAIAKLQGPFQLSSEQIGAAVTDIFAIAPVVDDAQLYDDDQVEELPSQGLSVGILCLARASGHVQVCLELDGVEAQWLPPKRSRAITLDDEPEPSELLLFQTAALLKDSVVDSLTFTQSPLDRHELLVTTSQGVYNLDFKSWTSALEEELSGQGATGVDFRFKMLLESAGTTVDLVIAAPSLAGFDNATTAVTVLDANLGCIVLTTTASGPHAASLELPYEAANPYEPDELLALPAAQPRESYQPPSEFFSANEVDKAMQSKRANPVVRSELAQPVRSKPETLQMLTDAHRVLSHETNRLGLAAADPFRRCERMCVELADQVRKVDEISQKVTSLTEVEAEDDTLEDEDLTVDARIEQRIMKIQSNATNMNERLEKLRRKMLRLGGEELSVKEHAFANEVWHLEEMIRDNEVVAPVDSMSIVRLPENDHELDSPTEYSVGKGMLSLRLHSATEVSDSLISQAEQIYNKKNDEPRRNTTSTNEYKKQTLGRVMHLLERETALIEAVTERLGRLGGLN
ncbi:hypothetical protein AMS68_001136 [Peltaster fructicola]|uniref:Uncharacterized protein n=1 Tax=Peltaster fructicola TaxID=286661 RepID=A0A6H0XLW4_9PEZI|nr:hypothetical protein AMS68_001136 [Peltaster fructicola]